MANQCKVNLTWKTANEENFDHFEIEYSANATAFTTVGQVPGNEDVNGSTYSFSYGQPDGKGYYRLKMVDIDGRYTYSPMLNILNNCGKAVNGLQVYPNPSAGNNQFISVQQVDAGMFYLRLFDINGHLLNYTKKEINAGNTIISMPQLNTLQRGTYILSAQFADGEIQNMKVIEL